MERLQRLGAYLRHLREQHNLSAAQCAGALGVGEASIYRIESGRIDTRASLLLGYAALVGASGEHLVGMFAQSEEVAA